MSREFCYTNRGYFWQEVPDAAQEHRDNYGSDPLVVPVADILDALATPLAAIAGYHCCDNGYAYVVDSLIEAESKLANAAEQLRLALRPWREVQQEAVEKYIKEQKAPT